MNRISLQLLVAAFALLGADPAQTQSIYQPYLFSVLAGSGGTGSVDSTGSAARFYQPTGVVADAAGNIYVADTLNRTIRKITPAGEVTTIAGLAGIDRNPLSRDGVGSDARFVSPKGVTLDNAGNIYVSDEFSIRKITSGAVVTTLAGSGLEHGSADGTGTNARFNHPTGIGVDGAGNVFVADTENYTIRKITPSGVTTTLAGLAGSHGSTDGTGSAARFYAPEGLALDNAGNIYVVDTENSTVRRVTPAGVVTTVAGLAGSVGSNDGTTATARFRYPFGLALDSAGNIYVVDRENHTIRKITSAGTVITVAGLAGVGGSADGAGDAARFQQPGGITLDSAGNAYIADTRNSTIRKLTSSGLVSTLAGFPGNAGGTDGTGREARFYSPVDVAVDSAGNGYVADFYNEAIRKVTANGVVSTFAGLLGQGGSSDGVGSDARFNFPKGVATDSAGNVFVADTSNYTIRKITPAGLVSTIAGTVADRGSNDGPANGARFNYPEGVAVDSTENVFVADTANHTIRRITPGGVVSTIAGLAGSAGSVDGIGSSARFNTPTGLAVDTAGNIYVADYANRTIRKIAPGNIVSTLAGAAGQQGSSDGAGSVARFFSPYKVTLDSAGNLYLTDTFNYTIRKITPSGMVTTLAGLVGRFGNNDGAGSTARFYRPGGIAVNSTGNLLVADPDSQEIHVGAPPVELTSAVSRKMHGNAGIFDIDLPQNGPVGIECRSGGATNDYTMVLSFVNNVSVEAAAVTAGTGNVNNFVVTGNETTINLTGVANAQTVTITLTGVNDGAKTGYAAVPMSILVGDVIGNGIVNSSDVAQIRGQVGQAVTSANFRSDVIVNGLLNSSDIILAKSHSGSSATTSGEVNTALPRSN
jgi:sugar lactone lactonase YvrE